MLYLKLINAAENVVFATHIIPPANWPGTTKYNLTKLGQLGRIISLTNFNFPSPPEFQPYAPFIVPSRWGKLKLKKVLDIIAGKNLYFAGGNVICCLANTFKSLYGLPQLFNQNLTFTLLGDYSWVVDGYGNALTLGQYLAPTKLAGQLGIKDIPQKKKDFLSYSFTYWRTHSKSFFPLSNAAKRGNVNVLLHHNDISYPLYTSERNKWTINIEVRKLSEPGCAIGKT
jgi:hypothetical protein